MCIGIPMLVIESSECHALCIANGEQRRIDTMLVGEQPAGTWLLTFLDTAREVLTAEKAALINDALQALELTMQGETEINHLFSDLINREPTLPDFLRNPSTELTPGD